MMARMMVLIVFGSSNFVQIEICFHFNHSLMLMLQFQNNYKPTCNNHNLMSFSQNQLNKNFSIIDRFFISNNFIEVKTQVMLKRLFSSVSDIQKIFEECKIDKTHEMCHPKRIVDLAEKYFTEQNRQNNHVNINISLANVVSKEVNISIKHPSNKKPTKKEEFIRLLLKKIGNENEVVRIKGLVVAHSIIKKTHNQQLIQIMLEEVDKYIMEEIDSPKKQAGEGQIQVSLQNGRSEFIKTNIISFYCQYLKKYLINFESVQFVMKVLNGGKPQGFSIMQVINNGFAILNLVNYILRSQYTFNKMGRYYLEHKQILNLFIMYLNDIMVFNDYIKLITNFSVKTIGQANSELLKHHFLFITEAQKTSDRLYEFFYNRYYYKEVKTLIEMPKFLTIQIDQFQKLVNHVRKRDKQLVVLVKRSKYESSSRSKSCYSRTLITEQDSNSSITKSECLDNSLGQSSVFEHVMSEKKRKQSESTRKSSKSQAKRSQSAYQ